MPTFLAWHFRLPARPGDDNDELEPEPPGEQRMGTRSNMKSLMLWHRMARKTLARRHTLSREHLQCR